MNEDGRRKVSCDHLQHPEIWLVLGVRFGEVNEWDCCLNTLNSDELIDREKILFRCCGNCFVGKYCIEVITSEFWFQTKIIFLEKHLLIPDQHMSLRLDSQHLQQLLQLQLLALDVDLRLLDTHEHPHLVTPPLGHAVDDAGQLHHEQAGVVRHIGLFGAEEVHWPHVKILLATSSQSQPHLRSKHLSSVQSLQPIRD